MTKWATYKTTCYTHDVANDPRSQGGVHHHQVRRVATGWQKRIKQSNGNHTAYGAVRAISDADGVVMYAMAQDY